MKKFKWLLFSVLIVCFIACLAGCGKTTLAAPADVKVDGNVLSWTEVENATIYNVDINGTTYVTSRTTYSLAMLSSGDYKIKVKAGDTKNEFQDSDWSEEISYTKEYESGIVYTLINSNTEYQVTRVGTARGDVKIVDTYRGKPVTKIADRAFFGSGAITGVEIGANVKSIGEGAFQNCSYLLSVTIPENVTSIGEYVFQGCRALTKIELPASIKSVPKYAFRYCRNLTEIVLNGAEAIEESAFEACSGLKRLTVSDKVKEIGPSAFAQCILLEELDLGDGVETLYDHAFYSCSALTSVTGGNSLSEIGVSAFEKCAKLSSFNFAENVKTIGKSAFSGCTALTDISIGNNLTSIGSDAFAETSATSVENGIIYAGDWAIGSDPELTAVTFKEGTVGIGDYAFARSKIERLELPETIEYIGAYAFSRCDSLNYLIIGDGVKDIGRYAFANCATLGRGPVSLGTKVETIQSYAFYNCANLGSPTFMITPITIPSTVKKIGTYAFKGTMFWTNTEKGEVVYVDNWAVGYIDDDAAQYTVEIKEGTIGISDYAFYNSKSLTDIRIGNTVNNIGLSAFYGCSELASVLMSEFYSELTYLSDYMFYRCSRLQVVTLPNRLTSIGRSAFYKSGLSNIDIKPGITEIGPYAFYGCESLLAVEFTNIANSRLTKIDDYVFAGCNNLTKITIPDSVTSVGYKSFNKCSKLETVNFGSGIKEIGDYAFNYCSAITELNLPEGLETIGERAFYKCGAVTKLNLGNSLISIGERAFYNCALLENLNLPNTLQSIGEYAFKGCNSITSAVIGKSIQSIGAHAFYGCKNLTVYSDAEKLPEGWNLRWNSGLRPVIWGCTLSEDGKYVVSFVNSKENVTNTGAKNGMNDPSREGGSFGGWAAVVDGEEKTYSLKEYSEIPEGAVLKAVWL